MSAKKTSPSSTEALACPSCGLGHPAEERFCRHCGMPLVQGEGDPLESPVSDAHGRARKIDPRYTEGPLVRVAGGRNQAEAELIQGLLLEEGVPSVLRRSAGFDVPDFLAAGPRDVMVPEAGAGPARQVLLAAELAPPSGASDYRGPNALRLALAITGGAAAAALVAWGLMQLGA